MKLRIITFLLFLLISSVLLSVIYMYSRSKDSPKPQRKIVRENPEEFLNKTKYPLVVRAAIPYWDQENAVESFKENADVIDSISLFWYYIDSDGDIVNYEYAEEDESIIEFAHEKGVKVSAVITNLPEQGTWSSKLIENVMKDRASVNKHIADIKNILDEKNFDGVTIDYESVNPSQQRKFTEFIRLLSQELDKEGKYVEVALHPQEDESSQKRYAFQNWEELAKYADRIYIMAYEEHWDEGDPGPPASIPWLIDILEYEREQDIPREKMLVGIPLYGYDWDTDSEEPANGLTYEEVQSIIGSQAVTPKWDKKSKTSYFKYGDSHEVWYEDLRSFEHKLQLVIDYDMEGITFWRLGGEDPRIWDVLRKIKTS
jgi:spore germination protein YaaH